MGCGQGEEGVVTAVARVKIFVARREPAVFAWTIIARKFGSLVWWASTVAEDANSPP